MKFKVGDQVKVKEDCSGTVMGEIYTLQKGDANGAGKYTMFAVGKDVTSGCNCKHNWIKETHNPLRLLVED